MTWVATEQRLGLAEVVLAVPAGMGVDALGPARGAVRDVCEGLQAKTVCIVARLTVVGVHVNFAPVHLTGRALVAQAIAVV